MFFTTRSHKGIEQLVDPASVYMLLSKTKPCMLKTKADVRLLHGSMSLVEVHRRLIINSHDL